MKAQSLSRRHFMKTAGALALGATAAAAAPSAAPAPEPSARPSGSVTLRPLGKTGLKVAGISIGTGSGQDANVIRYALRKGLNFIHTSTSYAGGRAIAQTRKAIQGQREKAIVGLKITWGAKDDKAMDDTLAKLGVDAVDIAFFQIHNATQVRRPEFREGAERWIKAGKCRHIGLTSHGDTRACLEAALDAGFYEVLMPSYNATLESDFRPVFERAEKAGVGVVLMKTQHGLDADAYAAAIPRYLATPAVSTICKTLDSFDEVDRALAAAAAEPAPKAELDRILRLAGAGRCSMCGACTRACPVGIPVADHVRISDYYLARAATFGMGADVFAEVRTLPGAGDCTGCGECEQQCPVSLPVRFHMRRAHLAMAGDSTARA